MVYSFSKDLIIFLPELFLLTTLLTTLLWGLTLTVRFSLWNQILIRNLLFLLVEVNILTSLLLLNNLHQTINLFYNSLISNNYTVIIKIILLLGTSIFLVIALDQVQRYFAERFEFLILLALAVFSLLLLVSAQDLITFYLSIEMQSLCLYVLAAFKRTSKLSTEAGLKYFILGALSSSFLLFGMSMIYGFVGSTNFDEIAKCILMTESPENLPYTFRVGIILLLCGLLFKLTAVPFHVWSPDVYEGAPLLVMIFFSTIPKFAIFCFFTKLLYTTLFDLYFIWQPLLLLTAAMTISFSSIATLYQKKIKRFLAYSSINHVGYMLMSLSTGTLTGLNGFFLYIGVYMITMFTFFCILLSLRKEKNKNIIYITDLFYANKIHPIIQIGFTLIFFSMAGIPPLIGFFAKFYVFFAAIDSNFYFLVVLSILCSTLSTFYYIRIIKIINFETKLNPINLTLKSSKPTYLYTWIGLLFITFSCIISNQLVTQTYSLGVLLN